jgi:hypothetical protein
VDDPTTDEWAYELALFRVRLRNRDHDVFVASRELHEEAEEYRRNQEQLRRQVEDLTGPAPGTVQRA